MLQVDEEIITTGLITRAEEDGSDDQSLSEEISREADDFHAENNRKKRNSELVSACCICKHTLSVGKMDDCQSFTAQHRVDEVNTWQICIPKAVL